MDPPIGDGHLPVKSGRVSYHMSHPGTPWSIMNAPAFDRYLRYDELTQLLKQFEREFNVAHLESIGTSHEGREVWALTITGPGQVLEKPGFLVDANIHGSEVTASMAALHFA